MKKQAYLMLFLSQGIFAQDPTPTSYPDVVEIPPPIVSLRSMNTGEPLRNGHYGERSEKNTHWRILDITYQNQKYVQFQVLDTNQCLTVGTKTSDCSDLPITAFELVATDTGAFVLSSSIDGSCLFSSNFRQYGLAQCLRPSQLTKPIPLSFLWAIVPPFGKTKLLKVPVK